MIAIAAGSVYLHHSGLSRRVLADPVLVITWVITGVFILMQLVLAWCQRAFTVNRRQQTELDQLKVTVVIPCYNEDPKILDRTIASLMRQTRLPDHIEVVDDGSTVDYTEIREWWLDNSPRGVRFSWVRQENAGKKHAQAVTFTSDHEAHIFVTIDSDSALDHRAIDEGLKPFADPRVVSVAGLETAINIDKNLLTRAIGHRSLVFQLFAMSAQSVARGSVLINPGAFSLYWAPLIRKIVPAYLGETFFGVPVTLGDDTALTMYALLHGRAVHQPTAVSMPVYPEMLSHHLKQWTRWMRASTIRMLWRLRYLPIMSYGWWFTVYTLCALFTSVAITLAIPLAWPATESLVAASLVALVIWPWAISLRLATVKRSDQSLSSKLIGVALLPLAALWYLLVLRQIRFYGIATCWRQGWVTRKQVEVRLDGSDDIPAQAPAEPNGRHDSAGGRPASGRPGAQRDGARAGYDRPRRPAPAQPSRYRQPALAQQGYYQPAPTQYAGARRAAHAPQGNGAYNGPSDYDARPAGRDGRRGGHDGRTSGHDGWYRDDAGYADHRPAPPNGYGQGGYGNGNGGYNYGQGAYGNGAYDHGHGAYGDGNAYGNGNGNAGYGNGYGPYGNGGNGYGAYPDRAYGREGYGPARHGPDDYAGLHG